MKTKSVSSKPICPPKPPPTVPMAEGADQPPSGRRATTIPEPKRPDPRKPALKTVRIARPYRQTPCQLIVLLSRRVERNARLAGPKHAGWTRATTYFRIGKDLRRDDFVGAKRLSRVDEGGEDFARLLDFTCETSVSKRATSLIARLRAGREGHLLPTDEGRGLWIPRGMVGQVQEDCGYHWGERSAGGPEVLWRRLHSGWACGRQLCQAQQSSAAPKSRDPGSARSGLGCRDLHGAAPTPAPTPSRGRPALGLSAASNRHARGCLPPPRKTRQAATAARG